MRLDPALLSEGLGEAGWGRLRRPSPCEEPPLYPALCPLLCTQPLVWHL